MSSWKSWRIPRITVANQWWHYIEINEWEREEDTCDQGLSQARENRRVGVPLQQNFYLVVSFINFLHTQTWSRKWREIWTIEPDEANLKQNQDSSHLTVNRSIGRKFSRRKTCRGRNFTHEETESQIELTKLISCHFESLAQSHELQKKKMWNKYPRQFCFLTYSMSVLCVTFPSLTLFSMTNQFAFFRCLFIPFLKSVLK